MNAEALARKATLLRVALEGLGLSARDGFEISEQDVEVVTDLAYALEGELRPDKHQAAA
jgi:hypothetical protein